MLVDSSRLVHMTCHGPVNVIIDGAGLMTIQNSIPTMKKKKMSCICLRELVLSEVSDLPNN